MLKRIFDVVASLLGLIIASPVLLPVMFLVWWQDRHSPLYVAERVGKNGAPFRMIKLRSMVINADRSGVDSTGADDRRITAVGHFIRRYKLDELSQLWNVLLGHMSLVGPRPNVKREIDLYTAVERKLLSVQPGVTDLASIVFADEGDILAGQSDPDIAYNQLIRPGKSALGLFYIEHRSLWMDVQLCCLTVLAILSRPHALSGVCAILQGLDAPAWLIDMASRRHALVAMPPPGGQHVVISRDGNSST